MRIRIPRNRQCAHCSTYNRPWRLTCMVCDLPAPAVTTVRARAALVFSHLSRWTDTIGSAVFALMVGLAAIRHGLAIDLDDLTPALAVYGGALVAVLVFDWAADLLRPDTGPDGREVADALRLTAEELADAPNRVEAMDELARHGGLRPLADMLFTLAARAQADVRNAKGNPREEAIHQQHRDTLLAASYELLSDGRRAAKH
ncbi:hypothetical protein ACFQ7N_40510 [Streptomyces niveus]|uniref:hypothetical protein n=1 Tax=Streptomyces niveus TaxID=193462 RepID=UPI00368A5AF3